MMKKRLEKKIGALILRCCNCLKMSKRLLSDEIMWYNLLAYGNFMLFMKIRKKLRKIQFKWDSIALNWRQLIAINITKCLKIVKVLFSRQQKKSNWVYFPVFLAIFTQFTSSKDIKWPNTTNWELNGIVGEACSNWITSLCHFIDSTLTPYLTHKKRHLYSFISV